MRQFPHIDTPGDFPGVPQNVFDTQSRYDYSIWNAETKLKLCNVNWDSSYRNVVDFGTDTARDNYFDSVIGYDAQLTSQYRMMPDGSIKLPLPFDEIVKYNYLCVDFGKSSNPLETNAHVARYYFFVDTCSFVANNTTELRLTLDAWTTYINRVNVNYMMLERGHAPMSKVRAEAYLENPLSNNKYLLADDVNFGSADITASSEFVPFGDGSKIILFATTIPASAWTAEGLGEIREIEQQGPGYYSDGTRSGSGACLTSLTYAGGGMDPNGLNAPVRTSAVSGGSLPNNLTVLAIHAAEVFGDAGEFFNDLAGRYPQALETIRGVWVVDESMVVLSNGHAAFSHAPERITWRAAASSAKTWDELTKTSRTYADVDAHSRAVFLNSAPVDYIVYEPAPVENILRDIELSKDSFGYPAEYADFAKLYTAPYAHLEIVSDTGAVANVKIEDTGKLEVVRRMSIAAPYMRAAAYLRGVGSEEVVQYTWRTVTGSEVNTSIPAGGFRDLLFEYEIPAFELYMSGYDAYRLHNFNANNSIPELRDAVVYENAARGVNTTAANTVDNVNKAYTNTSLSIETNVQVSRRDASTSLDNAKAGAATGYANAERSAESAYNNAVNSNATAYANASASANTGYSNADASAQCAKSNADASTTAACDNSNASSLTAWNNSIATADTTLSNTKNSSATTKKTSNNSAATSKTNEYNSIGASFQTTQNDLTSQAAQIATSNANAVTKTNYGNALQQALQAWEAGFERDSQNLENIDSGITGVSNAAAGVVTAATSAATGNIGQAIGGAVQAVGAAVGTLTTIAIGNEATELGITLSQNKLNENTKNATDLVTADTTTAAKTNDIHQTNVAANANLAKSTGETNADNTYNTATTNADLSETTTNANADATAATSKSNAKSNYETATSNAARARDTSLDNNERTYNNAISNAGRTKFTALGNAQRSKSTANENAERSRDTSVSNAERSRDTTVSNANRSYNAAMSDLDDNTARDRANATRDRDVALANNEYSRANSVESSQRTLSANAEVARLGYKDRRFDAPVVIGMRSGDPVPDEMKWRGIQLSVKTQNTGEIAQAGDIFARYGYALNQMWDFNGFSLMRHFTYWKCSDIWLTSAAGVIGDARRIIEGAFIKGVTVWRDPDEIGEVSIYENY